MACEETKNCLQWSFKKGELRQKGKIEGKLCLLLNALILTQILVTNVNFIIAQAIQ